MCRRAEGRRKHDRRSNGRRAGNTRTRVAAEKGKGGTERKTLARGVLAPVTGRVLFPFFFPSPCCVCMCIRVFPSVSLCPVPSLSPCAACWCLCCVINLSCRRLCCALSFCGVLLIGSVILNIVVSMRFGEYAQNELGLCIRMLALSATRPI